MTTPAPRSTARLYWLALGTFATGTEGFMIAPLLPDLARDFSVSLVAAGQLVTVFALTYALSSPVLTALTGDIDRRRLLIASMLLFAAANFVASAAHSYTALMGARVLLAIAAGLYVPNANALAGALVEPSRRGTALSIVTGGISVAVALGVPLGAVRDSAGMNRDVVVSLDRHQDALRCRGRIERYGAASVSDACNRAAAGVLVVIEPSDWASAMTAAMSVDHDR